MGDKSENALELAARELKEQPYTPTGESANDAFEEAREVIEGMKEVGYAPILPRETVFCAEEINPTYLR